MGSTQKNLADNKGKLYKTKGKKGRIILSLLGCFVILLLGVAVGSVYVSPQDIIGVVISQITGKPLPEHIPAVTASIIWSLRIPRALLAFVVGGALAVSGSVMQSVLKNPLASSYTLGVSSGAALGASIIIVTGFVIPIPFLGLFTLPIVGLLFGLGTVILAVVLASKLDRNMENTTIILTGMVFSLFMSAFITLIITFSKEEAQRLVFWQMGSFARKGWLEVGVLTPVIIILCLFLTSQSRELDMMTFGEEQAQAMGVDRKKTKWLLLGGSAVLTGVAVSFVGIIGFIDLFTPHAVRKVFGSSHRYVLPMAAIYGGSFMVLSDLIARTVASPSELPVGAVTALIGAPFFTYIFFVRTRKR